MVKKDIELLNGNGFEINFLNYKIQVTPDRLLKTTVKSIRTQRLQTITTDLKQDSCLQARKCFINNIYGVEAMLGDKVLDKNGEVVGVQCCLTQFNQSKESMYDSYTTMFAFGDDKLIVNHLNKYTYIIQVDNSYSRNNNLELILNIKNEGLHITLVTKSKEHLDYILGKITFLINNLIDTNLTEVMVIYGCETEEYGEGSNLDSHLNPKPIFTTESINNAIFHNDSIIIDSNIPYNLYRNDLKELDI